ncbi:hypothetical protein ACVWYG_002616 [Pedobacter sp. UYEF25]
MFKLLTSRYKQHLNRVFNPKNDVYVRVIVHKNE